MTVVIKITKGNDQIINVVVFSLLELKLFSNQGHFEKLVYINIYVYIYNIHIYVCVCVCLYLYLSIHTHESPCRYTYNLMSS